MALKTTRITVETETLTIIRRAKVALARCPGCGAEVRVILLDSGSLGDTFAEKQIREWIATGRLHYWRTAGAPVQICVPSLLHCLELDNGQRAGDSDESPLDALRRLL